MGEYAGTLGEDFVYNTCCYFDRKFGFDVIYNCYEARNSTSVLVDGKRIRFDVLAVQQRKNTTGHRATPVKFGFYCECKWRKRSDTLKSNLKTFLRKAIKTTPAIRETYADNFRFLFICNRQFKVNIENLKDLDYLKGFLGDGYSTAELNDLSGRTGIVILDDWFVDEALKGGV
ncbi:hypothetical protein MUP01_06660 [Candidatus Bathyarchaeota archaeon]|jgi:hypothetical protein|nr:hypothetical protein [Candidatus Bathyarchaeota archaeon]